MKKSFRFGIIQKCIMLLAFVAIISIWPMQMFSVTQVSKGSNEAYTVSNPSNEDKHIRQDFVPLYEKIKSISVMVCNDPESLDSLKAAFRIYDRTGKVLLEEFVNVEEYELPGKVTVPTDSVIFTPGELYFYTFVGTDGDLFLGYFEDATQKSMETGELYYCNIPSAGRAVVTSFEYEREMGIKRIVFFDSLFVLLAAGLIFAIGIIRDKCSDVFWNKVEKVAKIVCYVACGTVSLTALYVIVIQKAFTTDWLNILILALGVVLATVYAVWSVFRCPSEMEPLKEGERTRTEKVTSFVRACLWATLLIFAALHNNSMTDYEKGLHLREMIAAAGVLLFSYQRRKWYFVIPALVWSLICVLGGKGYVQAHNTHIEHYNTALRTVWAVWGIGLATYHMIMLFIETKCKELKKIKWIPFGITILYFIVNSIFNFENSWVILIVAFVSVFCLHYMLIPNKKEYLHEMVKGMFVLLVAVAAFCMLRRPFHYFMHTRYGGIFFTVTSNALFLCIPIAAALAKLVENAEKKWSEKLSYAILLGGGLSYMLFTVSRTGILAVSVMVLFAVGFAGNGMSKQAWKMRGKQLLLIICSFLYCLPIMYGATRMLPAVAGNPHYFGFEKGYVYFDENTAWDSENYITVKRFAGLVLENVFGVEDAYSRSMFWDIYGHEKPSYLEQQDASDKADENPMVGADVAVTDSIEEAASEETAKEDITEEVTVEESDIEVITTEEPVVAEEPDLQNDYSNGRFDVYKAYLAKLEGNGHKGMGITMDDGEAIVHAHNSYLQMAYNFGLVIGIFFLIFAATQFIMAILFALREKEFFPLMIIVAFGVASLVEFVYHPCIPLGFMFLMMPPVLFMGTKGKKKVKE